MTAMRPVRRSVLRSGSAALALCCILAGVVPASAEPGPQDQAPAKPAGPASGDGYPENLKQAGKDFLGDTAKIWTAPLHIRNKDVFPLILLAASTTFLIAADESINDSVQSYADRHAWVDDVSPVITQLGGPAGWLTAGAFFGAGLLFKDDRARDTGYLATSAMLQCMFVHTFVKAMTGRQRPSYADGEDHWAGPRGFIKFFTSGNTGQYDAFPSGHTSTAFALATVVSLQYRHTVWVPIVAYTLATGVGLSRMPLEKHWASDVLVGAVLGHVVARLVVRNYAQRRRLVPMLACSPRSISISLFYDLDPAGL
jgi:membrane-associated phospholipid phosphatase